MKLAAQCLVIGMIVSAPAGAGALSGLFKALFRGGDDAAAHAVGPAPRALDAAARSVGPLEPVAAATQAETAGPPPGAARAAGRALARCSGAATGDQDEEWRACGGEKPGPKP